MSDTTPAINEDLIKRYHENGEIANLISIFDFQRRNTLRAEALSQAYLNQMGVLQDRLNNLRREAPAQTAQSTSASPKQREPKPKEPSLATPNPNLIVDIEL